MFLLVPAHLGCPGQDPESCETVVVAVVLVVVIVVVVGEPVPEETFTHSHLSWLSIILYLLPPSIIMQGILHVHLRA